MKRRDVMSAIEAVIVAAIVVAFVVFAGVLAWAEGQTRDLPPGACIDEHRVPGCANNIGLIRDDHFARRRIEEFGVKLRDVALSNNRVVGGKHLLRRPPWPVTLDDASNGDFAD